VVGTEPLIAETWKPEATSDVPQITDTLAQMLQSVMADQLVDDVWMLARQNELRARASPGAAAGRAIPYFFAGPRERGAIGTLTSELIRERYSGVAGLRAPDYAILTALLGGKGPQHGEFMSNILFEPPLAESLIELGRDDALAALSADWRIGIPDADSETP
jgi:hypothetical protein